MAKLLKPTSIFSPNFEAAIDDMKKFSSNTDKGSKSRLYVRDSIQAFLGGVSNLGVTKKVDIQAFTASADIPDPQFAVDTFAKVANWDNRYESAFKLRQFNANQGTFEIMDISNGGLTFDQVVPGQSLSVKRFTGTNIFVKAKTYGDSIGWYWEMIEDRDFSGMFDQLASFTTAAMASKSNNHYRLLTDAAYDTTDGNANIAWQAGDSLRERDRKTLALAIDTIAKAVKALGFGDVATARYDVYASPLVATRLMDAMDSKLGAANGIGGVVPFNVVINPTYNLNRTSAATVLDTDFIVVLSGNKIQRGDKTGLTTHQSSDNLSFSEIISGRMRYGAAVAEIKQTIKGALA